MLAMMATSLPGGAQAANFTWIGGNSSDLANGSNWGAASTYSFTTDDDLYVNWTTAPPQYQPVLSGGKQVSISGITLGGTSTGPCAGCSGSLLVTGAGTKLTTANLTVRAGAGNGTVLLNVADQATVNSNVFIASKALINLTSGAKLIVTPGNLFSVNDGSVFNINSGATVQGGEASLTGGASMNLDGTGSSFKSTGYITVNGDPTRTSMINLSNGASLSGVFIIVGSGQNAALNIGAAEGSAATTAGTVVTSQSVQLGKNGVLTFNHTSSNYIFGSAIANVSTTSAGEIHQVAGTTILTGYSGGFTGAIIISGGTLQFGNGTGGAMAAKSIVTGTDATHYGSLIANRTADFVYNGVISGTGNVEQRGTGTATLAGINSFTGGLTLTRGTVAVSSDANLGDASGALHFNGGKLQVTADMRSAREITLSASTNTISVDNGKSLVLSGPLENDQLAAGQLIKSGNGTLILAAQNSYSGPTTISGGILQLGDGTSDGMIQGAIIDNANLVIANKADTSLSNTISGGGVLTQNGPASLTLSGNNAYSGGTHFNAGIVSVAQDVNLGLAAGALYFDGGTLQITGTAYQSTNRSVDIGTNGGRFDITDAGNSFQLTSALNGSGPFAKDGAGTLVLASDSSGYTGLLSVDAGQLRLAGASLGGAVEVKAGASLAGQGSIAGQTTVANDGVLMGRSGQQLSFAGGLSLAANSETSVELNGGSSQNALFDLKGDLALNGQLTLAQGSIATIGVYRIFDYSGNLSGTMSIADAAGGDVSNFSLQTSIDHQVNLINNGGRTIAFWNGTGQIQGSVEGGDGSWNATATNWSDQSGSQNSEWFDDTFAIFSGTAGHVTIASGYVPNIDGAQFTTDGYLLDGSPLTLSTGGDHTIIVGDGSLQSASMTATIASVIEGSEGLRKSGAGQLVLTGENSYTGTTTVTEGLLTLGEGGSIDPSSDIVLASTRYGSGNLAIDKTTDFTLSNQISGTGDVFKRGSGTTTFAGDNSFSGGLNVEAGTAKAGVADHAFGSGRVKIAGGATLDLADLDETIGGLDGNQSGDGNITLGSGTLTLNQDLHGGYSGVISGSGGLVKNGSGDLVLFGANSYSGHSTINAGSLVQGAQGGFSSASTYSVASGATMELGGFATGMAALNNAGSVAFGGQGGTVLSVSGDYVGNGGTLLMSTVLGDDSAQTDQLVVTGNTAGDTKLSISNRGGLGAQTVNGIKIIDVGGQSDGRFTLNGDYTTKDGQQAIMTASAYAYTLQKGSGQNGGPGQGSVQASGSANTDGNWYLVSQNTKAPDPSDPVDPTCEETNSCPPPQPGPPRYSAAAPIYQSYLANLKALNQLPTLTQRVGDRYLDGAIQATTAANAAAGETTPSGIWGRIEGAHNRIQSTATAGDLNQNINTVILQAGLDGQFYENDKGRVIAGLTGQYGNAHSNIDNRTGDGSGTIDTQAWGLGANATFYGNNGFYLDAQAQANWYDSDLDVDAVNRGLAHSNKGFGYALSLEAGQHVTLDENWSLTPQAQLMWSTVDFDSFTDSYGARISSHEGDNLNARLGLAANYQNSFTGADGRKVDTAVYGIANLYQTLIGNNRINYAGTRMTSDDDRSWAGIGLGGSYGWADNKYALYGEGSVNTSLNHFADSYTIKGNLGFKMKW